MNIPDPGLEDIGEEFLEVEYETGVAADPRVPSIRWEQEDGSYTLKLYSEEFLEQDEKAVAGKTLEDIVKKQVDHEDDFYVQIGLPSEGITPDHEVYAFSEEELDGGVREVVERYAEGV
jgi:hypothetical protein